MSAALWTSLASVLVALVAAGSAVASQRAAANASVRNTSTTSRTEIEKDAYARAEQLLDRQFKRQEEEIKGLQADVDRLNHRVRELEVEREEDRTKLAEQAEQIRTYAAILAARGIALP